MKAPSGGPRWQSNLGNENYNAERPSIVSVVGPTTDRFNEPNYHGHAPS